MPSEYLAPVSDVPAPSVAARFIRWLYDQQAGYAEVIAGTPKVDDPSQIEMVISTRRWMYYDSVRPDLVAAMEAYALRLAQEWGNVYVGVRLYDRRAKTENRRSEAYALPGQVIFIDDAPDNPVIPYSAAIRTSAGSLHAYYKCDRPTTKDDARRAAAALGGDKSGADLTQLVRVPGTRNTKNHGSFPVHLESGRKQPYCLDDLRRAWPDEGDTPVRFGQADHVASEHLPEIAIDWALVKVHLAHITSHLDRKGIPLRLSQKAQARRVLRGEMSPPSTSEARAFVCKGLMLHGYPDEEIAALLVHCCDFGASERKGADWLYKDIARLIVKYRAELRHITPTPTRSLTGSASVRPQLSRATVQADHLIRSRKGRQSKLQADDLLAWYVAEAGTGGRHVRSRKSDAKALGISVPTLDRLDRQLRERGAIHIETPSPRTFSVVVIHSLAGSQDTCSQAPGAITSPSVVVPTVHDLPEVTVELGDAPAIPKVEPLFDAITNPVGVVLSGEPIQPVQMRETVPVDSQGEHTHPLAPAPNLVAENCPADGTGIPAVAADVPSPDTPLAGALTRRPSLAELVREAFDAYPGARMTSKRIASYVAMNASHPAWPMQAIHRAIAAERKRRASACWEIERHALRTMTDAEVLSAVQGRQRTLTRHVGKPREAYHRVRLAIADAERQRRNLELPPPTAAMTRQGRRGRCVPPHSPNVPTVNQIQLQIDQHHFMTFIE